MPDGDGTDLTGDDPGALLARADAARDARRWGEAGRAYGAFLRLHPDDRGILVQRGHCLKEAGEVEEALGLYRRAEAAETRDPDIHLQIGHALKLLGRRAEAAESYGRALALDPGAPDPWREWRSLAAEMPAGAAAGPVLDLSDLVAWYGHRRAPSGIQRVQAEVAAAALAEDPGLPLCAMHPEEQGWRALPAALFHRLHALSRAGADEGEPAWREATDALATWRRQGPALRLVPGAVIVALGSAWWLPGYATALRAARAAGARHVPVLHDCGPLVLPDLAAPALRAEFGRLFSALPVLADGVIAVSRATAAEYRRLMARHLPDWPAPPAIVVTPDGRGGDEPFEEAAPPRAAPPVPARRLIALPPLRPAAGPTPPPAARAHPDLPEGSYVLLVSSLEPRKNHLVALSAWRTILGRRGAAATPRLVLVGRRAPGDAPVIAALEADPALAAQVTLLTGVDDAALARLYRGCLFTLYPSRHEGWGLPVSESLLHRRVPVVSDIPALRESGRQGAVFVPPDDAAALAEAAEALIADPARLAAAAARIPRHGGLRPWSEVAEDLLGAARRLAAGEREPPPPLPALHPIRLGHGDSPGPHPGLARAELVRHGGGWHPAEGWGGWTRPGRAALRLIAPDGEPARVALSLRAPPGAGGTLTIRLERPGAPPAEIERRIATAGEVAIEIGAGESPLEVTLEAEGTALDGGTEVGVGAVSVAVMRGGSLGDRVAYLESRLLVPARPVA